MSGEIDTDLKIWLWENDWTHPWPHEIGLLRSFLSECDKENLDDSDLFLVSSFLDDEKLDSSFENFIKAFDIPYMAEIAKKCVIGRKEIEKSERSIKISLPVGETSSLEFSVSEDGEFQECVYLKRMWQGDVRKSLPGDMARAYWRNLALHLDRERMEQKEGEEEKHDNSQAMRF